MEVGAGLWGSGGFEHSQLIYQTPKPQARDLQLTMQKPPHFSAGSNWEVL